MSIKPYIKAFLVTALCIYSYSCSNTKFLSDDQLLYTGYESVIISDTGKITDKRFAPLIESVIAYKPNNSIGGKRVLLPVGLWTYNYHKPDSGKKPRFIYRTFARKPVLISDVNPESRSQKLQSELYSIGYFNSVVRPEIEINEKNPRKAGIKYYVKPGIPFVYNDISFVPPTDVVDTLIAGYEPALSIKEGEIFDLEKIKEESKQITSMLLENGYYYFNQGNIRYIADTTTLPNRIDLRIGKDKQSESLSLKRYLIDDITVRIIGEQDTLGGDYPEDNVEYDGIRIISQGMKFRPEVFARAVYFRKGDLYSASKHRQTIIHLNSYGIFKYINLRYIPDPDTLVNKLDIFADLSPMKDISLDLEANVVTKSTGYSGPGVAATLAQGNLWGGANRLQLKLTGGFEWQWSGKTTSGLGTFSYNAGLSSTILFPKLVTPFDLFNKGRFSLPQTSVTLGYELLNKIEYYRMRSINLGFGYQWKRPERITHSFYPVFINSIELLKTTPEFDSLLAENPYIKKSFEEQFIVGMKYDFIYDNSQTKRPHGFYFQAAVNTSGNLMDFIAKRSSDESERPYSFLGGIYSQFLKLSADTRYYRNFRNKSLVFRFFAGTGIAYSNSDVMPYVEQFYSGGSNSIRAFQARYLGPGGTPPPEPNEEGEVIIDQTGDIKLEVNMEYRFRISKIVHGALFLESGNVWLLNPDDIREGADFAFSTFASQLAVGTGFGLRFDFDFFILRTDFGLPLRTPYINEATGSNWIRNRGEMFNNAIFNFAIGYPF